MCILTKVVFVLSFLVVQLTSQLFAQSHLSGGQAYGWYVIDPVSISGTPDFSDVFFVSDDEGWITSSSHAEIYHTTTGGETFEIQSTQYSCNAIYMINENQGYAGGTNGRVYRTTDAGDNWTAIGSIGVTLTDLDFATTSQGYACGDNGAVYSVTSGGATNLNSPSSSTFGGISAPSVNNVWVCGGNRIYYYNGTNFTSQSTPGGTFNDIHFISNLEGWVVGNSGVIGHTTDGGASWVTQTNPDTQNRPLISVFFLDTNNGWAVGNGGIILHTTNGGTTWTVEGAGLTTAFLRGVHFTSTTNGYVVGNDKTLIKFGEITSVENEEELPAEFSLLQNWPNPFNPATTIKYQIPELSFVTMKIYDVLGNEFITLVNEKKPVGSYKVEFNATSLPSGVYFYRLQAVPTGRQAGSFVETKKMVLMK